MRTTVSGSLIPITAATASTSLPTTHGARRTLRRRRACHRRVTIRRCSPGPPQIVDDVLCGVGTAPRARNTLLRGFFLAPFFLNPVPSIFTAAALYAAFSWWQQQQDGGSSAPRGGRKDGAYGVAKVQVALLGSARFIQADLDRMARTADTSSRAGLHALLQDAVLSLIRKPEYFVYGASDGKRLGSPERAEQIFNEYEMLERGKFKEETMVNVQGGRRETSSAGAGAGQGSAATNELIVVTILVAVEGALRLPRVTDSESMVAALNRLGSVTSNSVQAVEILWTPQDPSDYYTKDELLTEYPNMQVF